MARDGGGKDVFVHIWVLERSGLTALYEGRRVMVDIVEGRKGPEAARVRFVWVGPRWFPDARGDSPLPVVGDRSRGLPRLAILGRFLGPELPTGWVQRPAQKHIRTAMGPTGGKALVVTGERGSR